METNYLEDFQPGSTFKTSARTITETDLLNYAGLSGNYHSIHLDKEKMTETEFGGRLVYGNLVLVFVEGLRIGTGLFDESVIASYGYNKIRFTNPVFVEDTIHAEIAVDEVEKKDEDSGIIKLTEKGVNQNDETVLVAESRQLIKRRP